MESKEGPRVDVVETALGPVGFSRKGEGPPVLMVHGSPGGIDSTLAMGRFIVEGGFELIAPARPGYPGTNLKGRESIDQQADLHAALLEALGISQAGLITWSGGGPSGYRLAARHPGLVSSLVGFASVSKAYQPPKESLDERLVENTSAGNWLLRQLAVHAPRSTVSSTLGAEGDLGHKELKALVDEAMDHENQKEVVLTMALVVADHANREAGLKNDMARFGEIESLELESIGVPSLIIHGTADVDVTPDHGEYAAETIPGAELIRMDRGTHLSLFVHPDAGEVQGRVLEHFRAPFT
ncbi:MAG: alpha/beta hydrolase [Solirubrobacterales bacterium]|nr:alpha/beta hydrolase [Solirubrobacterales bacterium]